LKGLIKKTALNPALVDRVIMGTVIQEAKTSNIAREALLAAGFPDTVPGFTVSIACISSNQAVSSGVDLIQTGRAQIVVASGTETMSDVPIRYSRKLRLKMLASRKAKGFLDYLKLLRGIGLKDLIPEAPSIAEFSTGEIMGHSADRLASMFSVTREEQDKFAQRSHVLAAKALGDGILKEEIAPVLIAPEYQFVTADNGVRGDTTYEKLSTLKPAFIKPHGTVTAGNSSFTTDGASALLLMSEAKALEMGYKPRSIIKDYVFTSQDPKDELLLGPAYATARLLDKNNLSIKDIDVWEFHEAFAAQILANLKALDSDWFAKEKLGRSAGKVGRIPMEKFNVHGGSLSLGHPFGATGCRLVTTASNRLIREGGRYAVIAACAAGGHATACLIERYDK